MAEYGASATQLSAPQGAGTQVVQPTQENYPVNHGVAAIGGLVDIFAKGLIDSRKAEAEKRKNDVIGQYVKEQTLINDGITQGMDPSQAAARSRASANKYLASYPEYYKDFSAAQQAIKGITVQSEVEDQLTLEKKLYEGRITRAQTAGFSIDASQPKNVVDLQLKAYETSVRADAELSAKYRANAENRAQSAEDRAVFQQEVKTTSIRLINEIAGSRMEASSAYIANMAANVKSGKTTYEDAQIQVTREFSVINAAIQSAASINPELAAPYRTLFGELQKLGMDLINPENQIKDTENKIKQLINQQKLIILATPQHAAVVATSQLLGANAQVALTAGNMLTPTIAAMINTPIGSKEYVPQVVGNPGVQTDTVNFLRSSLQNLPKYSDQPKAKTELINSINQVLKQTGDQLDKGVDAKQLKELATFFASSEYGQFSTSGLLSKEAAQAANKTFKLNYEPTVIGLVKQQLTSFLQGQASYGQKQNEPTQLSNVVDIQFSGSGILFTSKPQKGLDPNEQASQVAAVRDLNGSQMAINQLIHMGAHLEGTTDYAKYWDERKHVWFPEVFPKPELLKVGQEVDGYVYLGGAYGNPRSWRPASKSQ